MALLRGINVGGSGLLPMKDLSDIFFAAGFTGVRTYIQSGNVVFESSLPEVKIRSLLEPVLEVRVGKAVNMMVRSAPEMQSILSCNPFPDEDRAKVGVTFLHQEAASALIERFVAPGGELIRASKREVYVFYPQGMGQSKLRLPLDGAPATVRNMNTVAKLVALTGV